MIRFVCHACIALCLLGLCCTGCGKPPPGVSAEDMKPLEITVEPRGDSGKFYLYVFKDRYKQGKSFFEAFETEVKGANEVVIRVPADIAEKPRGDEIVEFLTAMSMQFNKPVRVIRVVPPKPEPESEDPETN